MGKGTRTRDAILEKAVDLASVAGLEGVTIGALATQTGLSKSGLFAHFGSKENLEVETLRAAADRLPSHRKPAWTATWAARVRAAPKCRPEASVPAASG